MSDQQQPEFSVGDLMRRLRQLDTDITVMGLRHKAELKPLNDAYDVVQAELHKRLVASEQEKFVVEGAGTFKLISSEQFSIPVADFADLVRWAVENDMINVLETGVKKTVVNEYRKAHVDPETGVQSFPPGVKMTVLRKPSFTK